jgi:hypothetical protein
MDGMGFVPRSALCAALLALAVAASARAQEVPYGAFSFQDSVRVPGSAEAAFDAFVDVNAWWDHRFSTSPARFYIEPRAGGGFWELFDEQGNGVRHATVIYVQRPETLRMEGPLGLSGNAIQVVFTLSFSLVGDSTTVHLDVHAAGEVQPGWPGIVRQVWRHFLERYQAYVAGRLE